MSPHLRRYMLIGLVGVILGDVAVGQEQLPSAPPPSSTGDRYLDLRQSEDRVTQRYAERYYNLVKLQAWTSANNTSTVNAKYVDHDPDLKWVKLATVRGSGQSRVVKEVTVPVDKLNKSCQSRVRQIVALQTKLDELAAEAKEDPAGGEAGYGEYGRGRGEYGAPMVDERGEQPAAAYGAESPDAESGRYNSQPAAPPAGPPTPVIDPNDPDPLGFAEVANQTAAVSPVQFRDDRNPGFLPPGGDGFPTAGAADRTQWASSYAAFQANFTVNQSEEGEPTVEWGELSELRELNEEAIQNLADEQRDPYRQRSNEIVQRLDEVRWSAVFTGLQPVRYGGQEVRFRLPPLPAPLKIQFLADPETLPSWTELPPNQPVQFIGKLDIVKPHAIIVRVRRADLEH